MMDKNLRSELDRALWRSMTSDLQAIRKSTPQSKWTEEEKREFTLQLQKNRKRAVNGVRKLILIFALTVIALTGSYAPKSEQVGGCKITYYEMYAHFYFRPESPIGIDTLYRPTYIPDGLTETMSETSFCSNGSSYDQDDKHIRFDQLLMTKEGFTFDTEKAEYGFREIAGETVFYRAKKKTLSVVFRREECIIILSVSESLGWEELDLIFLGIKPAEDATAQ